MFKKSALLGSLIAVAAFGTAQAEPLFAFLTNQPAQTQQVAPQYAPQENLTAQADVGEDAQLLLRNQTFDTCVMGVIAKHNPPSSS